MSPLVEEILNSGYFYVHGRDKMLRPCLVITPINLINNAPNFDGSKHAHEMKMALTVIVEYVRKLFLPGQIENLIMVMNPADLGVTQVDQKTMREVFGFIALMFKGQTRRTFVMNAGMAFSMLWKVCKPFLNPAFRLKCEINEGNTSEELLKMFHPSQVEKKFGGEAEDVTENFWPPKFPSANYGANPAYLMNREEYKEYQESHPGHKASPDLEGSFVDPEYNDDELQALAEEEAMAMVLAEQQRLASEAKAKEGEKKKGWFGWG